MWISIACAVFNIRWVLEVTTQRMTAHADYFFLSHPCAHHNTMQTGHIPVHIGRLHSLSTLLLHSNHLVGSIPDSIGDLLMLEELNLSNNHLKGMVC